MAPDGLKDGGKPLGPWRCRTCGSDRIEARAFVRMNTGEVTSFDEEPDYYCPDCEEAGDEPWDKYPAHIIEAPETNATEEAQG